MAKTTKKPKKPPLDKKSVLERLVHAQEQELLVHVRRWIPDADRITGFVVRIEGKCVVLQMIANDMTPGGWCLLRLKDIQAVSTNPDPDCFAIRAFKARGVWPPTGPDLELDGVVGAVTSAAAAKTMLAVYDEFYDPDVCWFGCVPSLDESNLQLLEVDNRGHWDRKPRAFQLAAITRLDIGSGYHEALSLVAGPPPS